MCALASRLGHTKVSSFSTLVKSAQPMKAGCFVIGVYCLYLHLFSMNKHHNIFWALVVLSLLVIIPCGYVLYTETHGNTNSVNNEVSGNTVPPAGRVVLQGELTCLPHKQPTTGGPYVDTKECARGFKDVNGNYYSLSSMAKIVNSSLSSKVTVTGILILGATQKAPGNQVYDTVGTIQGTGAL